MPSKKFELAAMFKYCSKGELDLGLHCLLRISMIPEIIIINKNI